LNIIFVCTGNTCRSPMAEGFMKKLTSDDKTDYKISSRGIAVMGNTPASENSVLASAEYGVDISSHVSSQLSGDGVKNAGIIVTVTQNHAELIKTAFPEYAQKVHSASEITGEPGISDPYGGSLEIYQKCAGQIMDLCRILYEKIRSENQ